jgi:hypothetical protein
MVSDTVSQFFPGHQTDDIEYVVKQNKRYVVVDKGDAYEHLVE